MKTWNDITYKQYEEINEILTDKEISQTEKLLICLSILNDKEPDYYFDKEIGDISNEIIEFQQLITSDLEPIIKEKIEIDGVTYYLVKSVENFTTAQYIDFFELSSKEDRDNLMILGMIYIPEGKKYNKDYDLLETIEIFRNKFPARESLGALSFFFRNLKNSTDNLLHYSEKPEKKILQKKNILKRLLEKIHLFG